MGEGGWGLLLGGFAFLLGVLRGVEGEGRGSERMEWVGIS